MSKSVFLCVVCEGCPSTTQSLVEAHQISGYVSVAFGQLLLE